MRKEPRQNQEPLDPILVTPAEACRLLGCSLRHLYTLVSEGLIEVRYVGTGRKNPPRRVVMASIRRYVESLPQDPPSAA